MYFVIYALGDEYLGILHYLPSTGHNDSMAVGYVLVNVTPGMEIEAFNKIKGINHVDDIRAKKTYSHRYLIHYFWIETWLGDYISNSIKVCGWCFFWVKSIHHIN